MCRRCGGQLLRSFPDLEPTCLLCGWYLVEIPSWVQEEYVERLGLDENGRPREDWVPDRVRRYQRRRGRRGTVSHAGVRL